jgi:hypothetical protein
MAPNVSSALFGAGGAGCATAGQAASVNIATVAFK